MPWFKGNLHTHTDLSDGDSPPKVVARWYDDAGYDFLCISDHNLRFDPLPLQRELAAERRSLHLLPGEELTSWWQGGDRVYALHVNGYGTTRSLVPREGESVPSVLQALIDAIAGDGGIASVNHPNFWSSIGPADLAALRGLEFFEVYNGHPLSLNEGDKSLPATDVLWDHLLTSGHRVMGLGVDDAHDFQEWGEEFRNPGRAWISVQVEELSTASILEAMKQGRFYASNGPVLETIERRRGEGLRIACRQRSRIEFIADGKVIDVVEGEEAFRSLGRARYLRARITDGTGTVWVQPVWKA